jgi:hypothetical protein
VTFGRVWILLVAWTPLAWAAWQWSGTTRRTGLILKALTFTAILLALAEPEMGVWETKMAVAVLADTSEKLPGSRAASKGPAAVIGRG